MTGEYFAAERIKFRCKCGGKDSETIRTLSKMPRVLIAHIKDYDARGSRRQAATAVQLSVELPGAYGDNAAYALTGVIKHRGMNTGGGHYVSYRRSKGRLRYEFDDSKVNLCLPADAVRHEVDKAGVVFAPYMLFYELRQESDLNCVTRENLERLNRGDDSSSSSEEEPPEEEGKEESEPLEEEKEESEPLEEEEEE